jgi:hypothetical protein
MGLPRSGPEMEVRRRKGLVRHAGRPLARGGVEWPSAPLVQINDRDWIRALLRQAVTDMPKNLADEAWEGSSLTHRAVVAIRELGVKSKLHDCDEDPVAAATLNRGSAVCQAVVSLSIL